MNNRTIVKYNTNNNYNTIDLGSQKARIYNRLIEKQNKEEQIKNDILQKERENASFSERLGATLIDVPLSLVEGIVKSGEGVVDSIGSLGDSIGLWDYGEEKVKKDWTQETLGDKFDELTNKSYLKQDGVLNTLAESVGGQLPHIALNFIPGVGPALSAGYFFLSAQGNATESALNEGATYSQAKQYGFLNACVEEATEMIGGWAFGEGFDSGVLNKTFGKTGIGKKVLSSSVGKFLFNMAGEGFEEMLSELIDPFIKYWTYEKTQGRSLELANVKDVLTAGFYGALSAGVLQGGSVAINNKYYGSNRIVEDMRELNSISREQMELSSQYEEKKLKLQDNDTETMKYNSRMDELNEMRTNVVADMEATMQSLSQEKYDKVINKLGNASLNHINLVSDNGGDILLKPISIKDFNRETGKFKDIDNGVDFETNGYYFAIDNEIKDKYKLNNEEALQNIREGIKTFFVLNSKLNNQYDIIFTDDEHLEKGINGLIDKDTNTMYINIGNANNQIKPIKFIVGHEFTHTLEGSKYYNEMLKFVQEDSEYLNSFEKKKKLYEKQLGTKLDEAYINAEMIADYVGDNLTSEKYLNRLQAKNKGLFGKLKQFISEKLRNIKSNDKDIANTKKLLSDAEKTFEKILDSKIKETFDGVKYYYDANSNTIIYNKRNKKELYDANGKISSDDQIKLMENHINALSKKVLKNNDVNTEIRITTYKKPNKEIGYSSLKEITSSKNTKSQMANRDYLENKTKAVQELEDIIKYSELIGESQWENKTKGMYVFRTTIIYNNLKRNVDLLVNEKNLAVYDLIVSKNPMFTIDNTNVEEIRNKIIAKSQELAMNKRINFSIDEAISEDKKVYQKKDIKQIFKKIDERLKINEIVINKEKYNDFYSMIEKALKNKEDMQNLKALLSAEIMVSNSNTNRTFNEIVNDMVNADNVLNNELEEFIKDNGSYILTNFQAKRINKKVKEYQDLAKHWETISKLAVEEKKYYKVYANENRIISNLFTTGKDNIRDLINKKITSNDPSEVEIHESVLSGLRILNKINLSKINSQDTRYVVQEWYNKFYNENNKNIYLIDEVLDLKDNFDFTSKERLTLEELSALKNIIRHNKSIAKSFQTVIYNERRMSAKTVSDLIFEKIKNKKQFSDNLLVKIERSFEKPITMLDSIGLKNLVYDRLKISQDRYFKNRMGLLKPFDDFINKNKNYYSSLLKEKITIKNVLSNGEYKDIVVSKGEALTYVMWSKREQAQKHMLLTDNQKELWAGFKKEIEKATDNDLKEKMIKKLKQFERTLPKGINVYKKSKGSASNIVYNNVILDNKNINSILEQLNEKDLDYMKIVNEVLNGNNNEENQNISARKLKSDADIDYIGYSNVEDDLNYFPVITDKSYNVRKNYGDARTVKSVDSVLGAYFNQDINPNANNSLKSSNISSLVLRHLDMVAKYNAYYSAIKDIQRTLNVKSNNGIILRQEISKLWSDSNNYIDKLIIDLIDVQSMGAIEKTFSKLRSNLAVSTLGLNPKVWFNQISSLPTALSMLSNKSIIEAAKLGYSKTNRENMDKYCVYAKYRNYTMEGAIAETNVIAEAYGKIQKAFMAPINKFDRTAIITLWNACQLETKSNKGLELHTEENMKEAGKLLEDVIRQTQPNYNALESPEIKRTNSEILKTMVMYTTQPLQNLHQLTSSFRNLRELKRMNASKEEINIARKKLIKSFESVILANMMYCLIGMAFKKLLGKDDKEKSFFNELMSDFLDSNVGMIPIVKELYNKIFRGYDMELSTLTQLNNVIDGSKTLYNGIVKGDDPSKVWYNFTKSMSGITGLPLKNITEYGTGIIGTFDPNTAYKYRSIWYNKSVSEYTNDFEEAYSKNDNSKSNTIIKLIFSKNGLEINNKNIVEEYTKVMGNGNSITPTKVNSSMQYNNITYELSSGEQKRMSKIYSELSNNYIGNLINNVSYNSLSYEEKAKAINFINKNCYLMAFSSIKNVNVNDNKNILISKVIDMNILSVALAKCNGTLKGNKNAIFKYINSLRINKNQKHLLYGLMGYKNSKADIKEITKYLRSLGLNDDEINRALTYCNLM